MKYALVAAVIALAAGPALAQSHSGSTSTSPSSSMSTTPSTSSGSSAMTGTGGPATTEAQAKTEIQSAGYSSVSGLKKNSDGSWTAKGSKGGASHMVMLGKDGRVVEE